MFHRATSPSQPSSSTRRCDFSSYLHWLFRLSCQLSSPCYLHTPRMFAELCSSWCRFGELRPRSHAHRLLLTQAFPALLRCACLFEKGSATSNGSFDAQHVVLSSMAEMPIQPTQQWASAAPTPVRVPARLLLRKDILLVHKRLNKLFHHALVRHSKSLAAGKAIASNGQIPSQ